MDVINPDFVSLLRGAAHGLEGTGSLEELQYHGPVALSCDDTKLLPSLRPYYDQDREGYFLMGHVGQPLQLIDHEAFRVVVKENNLEKATKVRKILQLEFDGS